MRRLRFVLLCLALTAASCGSKGDKASVPDPWAKGNTLVEHQEPMNIIRIRSLSDTSEVKELRYNTGEWNNEWDEYFNEERWEVIETESIPEYVVKIDGFRMLAPDESGVLSVDQTASILSSSTGVVMVTLYDLDEVTENGIQKIRNAVKKVQMLNEEGIDVGIVLLTSARYDDEDPVLTAWKWLSENQMEGIHLKVPDDGSNNVYFTFYTDIKNMHCGNPGFMYLENGVVLYKEESVDNLKIK